ncbi:MAG: DNA cytosine methyltransferase [Planctomycetales bacterium]|nr:DNA cytosine methyltransferase [Planctomycetales bacterium]
MDLIDPSADDDPTLRLETATAERFARALDIADRQASQAVTACFASSYGKSIVRSGSYLRLPPAQGPHPLRRFSPTEVARLPGFPADYHWSHIQPGKPERLTLTNRVRAQRLQWKLLGNSLSIPVVRHVLQHLPMINDFRQ